MKRAVIVHCWEGYPDYCWYPQTKKELAVAGFKVEIPAMPETERPRLLQWLSKLREVVGKPDEDTYLVGHSVGCITILRYLESLDEGQKVGGVVLVAGFIDDLGYMDTVEDKTVLPDFFRTPVDFELIKSRAKKFVAIHSDDDPFVQLKHADIFKTELDAEVIIKHGAKHFSGPVDAEESRVSLPEVTQAVLQITKQ